MRHDDAGEAKETRDTVQAETRDELLAKLGPLAPVAEELMGRMSATPEAREALLKQAIDEALNRSDEGCAGGHRLMCASQAELTPPNEWCANCLLGVLGAALKAALPSAAPPEPPIAEAITHHFAEVITALDADLGLALRPHHGRLIRAALEAVAALDSSETPAQAPDGPLAYIDMLMADRLRNWAHCIAEHGGSISDWGDPDWVAGQMREIAQGLEDAIKAVPPAPAARREGTEK